jgi:ABC-type transport system involved in multi-copper enzyme maturation permease subunit
MEQALSPPGPLGLTTLLFAREARTRLASPWFYVVASIICLIAWLYGAGFQQTFVTESVLVTVDPLMALDIIVILFMGIVLGLRLAAGLAWEREHRTLEVLLVGPVSSGSIIAAKFLVEICIMAILMLAYVIYLLLAQPLGAGVIALPDMLSIIQMIIFALPTLALGLLVGAWARTVRGAVVAFVIVTGMLLAYELLLVFLQGRPIDQISLSELYLRSGMEAVAPVLSKLSAAGQLSVLIKVVKQDAVLSATTTLWAAALTLLTLALAVMVARLRGAS